MIRLKITDIITVTELSRLTQRTRPTIYKYINDYQRANYDVVPFSIKSLFDMILINNASKEDIRTYCLEKFGQSQETDVHLTEVINMLKENSQQLDLNEVINFIKERLKKNG